MKTAVVTGATSMLGIATVKRLIENNIKVIAISRANSHRREALPKSDLLTFVGCELDEMCSLDMSKVNVLSADVFYHFGWGFTDRSTRINPELQNKNVDYTIDAINLAQQLGCKRFLGAGSQAEYGFKDCEITEETECTPSVAYGHAKLNAYNLGREKCKAYGMEFIWTRTFSVYGVNDGNTMVRYALNCHLNNETAQFSAATQSWNFLFEDDAGEYFYRLGFYDGSHFSAQLKDSDTSERIDCIVNVGNVESKQLKLYFEEMQKAFGEDFKYELAKEDGTTPGGVRPNVSRLIDITGYYPKYTFEDGMRIMFTNASKIL